MKENNADDTVILTAIGFLSDKLGKIGWVTIFAAQTCFNKNRDKTERDLDL